MIINIPIVEEYLLKIINNIDDYIIDFVHRTNYY